MRTRRSGRGRRGLVIAVAAPVVALVLAACTGIPDSSSPETIKPIPVGEQSLGQAITPEQGALPSDLVRQFLDANATEPGKHASARNFLTPAARSRWTDTTATIVTNETVGTYKPGQPAVIVRGSVVGTLTASGIYTPSLQGQGDGGATVPFEYRIKKVNGQFRIDNLRNGLLLTTEQFEAYKPHSLYFYDLAERYLVPDERWSALESTPLKQWLLTQLVNGPRPELQNAVNSDTLPTQTSTRRIVVSGTAPTRVEIPGSSQLNSSARDQLAAQIGHTLNTASSDDVIIITDGGTPVRIPSAGSSQFTASGFIDASGPSAPHPDVYYLEGGRIYGQDGRKLGGPVNNPTYFLNSIAMTRAGKAAALTVAAVSGTGNSRRLLVGTQSGGLHPVGLQGDLTRPAWAPGLAEAWIGDGRKVYRVTVSGKTTRVSPISIPSSAAGGRIVALRLSPEGSRVAIVISGGNNSGQLYVGSVVRTAGQVRIDTLQPVSPDRVVVQDVGWIESTTLFAIGYDASSQDSRVFETNVDGSVWRARGIGVLQDPPDSVAVAVGNLAWVSSGGAVWEQHAGNWESPGVSTQTLGTAPVYLE